MVDMIHDIKKVVAPEKRERMKGIMSAAMLFMTISTVLIAQVFLVSNERSRKLTSENLIADRIYYIYKSIEDSTTEIIEKELGNATEVITMNVTIDEQPDYSYVNFTEKFPQNVSEFNEDLDRYERFVEEYLNETNILVDTSISGLGGKMENIIEPYGISYTHVGPWGNGDKRQYEIIPGDGLDEINGYTLTIQLINGWEIMPERGEWAPLKSGDLKFNITIISYDGSPVYTTEEYVSRTLKSTFKIDSNTTQGGYQEGWIRAIISDVNDGGMLFEMHLTEAVVSTGLNLTEIPGETRVELPDGKINVIENLYNIQKNGTVGI